MTMKEELDGKRMERMEIMRQAGEITARVGNDSYTFLAYLNEAGEGFLRQIDHLAKEEGKEEEAIGRAECVIQAAIADMARLVLWKVGRIKQQRERGKGIEDEDRERLARAEKRIIQNVREMEAENIILNMELRFGRYGAELVGEIVDVIIGGYKRDIEKLEEWKQRRLKGGRKEKKEEENKCSYHPIRS